MDQATSIEVRGPLLHDGPKLFVIDARNRVERQYLLDWLHSSFQEGGPGKRLNLVTLSLAKELHDLDLSDLSSRLDCDPNTLIVPLRIAWRVPNFQVDRAMKLRHLVFGNPRQPGSLRARIILLRDRRRAHCLMGEPATIAALQSRFAALGAEEEAATSSEFTSFVARQAGLALDRAERGLRGSRYKVPRYVAEGLRTSPKFRGALKQLAEQTGKSSAELQQEARQYMKELIATPTAMFIDLRARFEKFMLGQGYDEQWNYRSEDLDRLRMVMRDHPTLVLFTHKTYIDGTTPSYLMHKNDLPMLHLFGGINLDMFAFGTFFRRSGTIFIRRSFQDNPVYKLVLRHYIGYLLEKRFPMSWAFEGTRSRLGKLMPPRYGLLKYVLDAAYDTQVENVHIIPFVTSFDLIRDVEEYASEQRGRVKKPESFKWFIGYIRSLREPMGKIHIDLGEPVVVKQAPDPDDKLMLSKLAFEVSVQANKVTPLTMTSVMCLCLLGAAPRGVTSQELHVLLPWVIGWAKERGIRMSPDLDVFDEEQLTLTVDRLVESGLLLRYDQGSTIVYSVEPSKHPMASYYRNTIVHHFLNKAILELAISKVRENESGDLTAAFWAEADRLRDLFKFEFFYPAKVEYRNNLEAELNRIDSDWQAKLAAGGPLLKALRTRFLPFMGHAVFLPFVEAYSIVFDILARLEQGAVIDQKTLVKQALAEGRQAYLLRRITSEASIGKILFENGFELAKNLQLAGETTAETRLARRNILAEFRALSRRMEKLRLDTLALADRMDL